MSSEAVFVPRRPCAIIGTRRKHLPILTISTFFPIMSFFSFFTVINDLIGALFSLLPPAPLLYPFLFLCLSLGPFFICVSFCFVFTFCSFFSFCSFSFSFSFSLFLSLSLVFLSLSLSYSLSFSISLFLSFFLYFSLSVELHTGLTPLHSFTSASLPSIHSSSRVRVTKDRQGSGKLTVTGPWKVGCSQAVKMYSVMDLGQDSPV